VVGLATPFQHPNFRIHSEALLASAISYQYSGSRQPLPSQLSDIAVSTVTSTVGLYASSAILAIAHRFACEHSRQVFRFRVAQGAL
jgi:hypothetical protein